MAESFLSQSVICGDTGGIRDPDRRAGGGRFSCRADREGSAKMQMAAVLPECGEHDRSVLSPAEPGIYICQRNAALCRRVGDRILECGERAAKAVGACREISGNGVQDY